MRKLFNKLREKIKTLTDGKIWGSYCNENEDFGMFQVKFYMFYVAILSIYMISPSWQ
jgi:hypothetical protein